MAKNKRTSNNLQNTTQKTKDRATRTPLKIGGELMCSDYPSTIKMWSYKGIGLSEGDKFSILLSSEIWSNKRVATVPTNMSILLDSWAKNLVGLYQYIFS